MNCLKKGINTRKQNILIAEAKWIFFGRIFLKSPFYVVENNKMR